MTQFVGYRWNVLHSCTSVNLFDKLRKCWLASPILWIATQINHVNRARFDLLTITNTCLPIVNTSDNEFTNTKQLVRKLPQEERQALFVAKSLCFPTVFVPGVHTHQLEVSTRVCLHINLCFMTLFFWFRFVGIVFSVTHQRSATKLNGPSWTNCVYLLPTTAFVI